MESFYPAGKLKKVEIHVHLEGSIAPETLLRLAQKHRIDLPAQDIEGLRRYFQFRDFGHFIEVYRMVCGCLREPEDFETIAYEFGAFMARQSVLYAEATFTPYLHVKAGIDFDKMFASLSRGRERARRDFGVRLAWIFDIPRQYTAASWPTLEFALAGRDEGVVALGLGGDEANFPPELFVSVYERARARGLHVVAHAGETAGPQSIWSAIRKLGAERIGHGVRSIEDPELVRYLAELQIPIEVCPTSNLRLGVYPSYQAHPLLALYRAGVKVTINSDDPPLFNTDLGREYDLLGREFALSAEDITRIALNAVDACFLPDEEKPAISEAILQSGRGLETQKR